MWRNKIIKFFASKYNTRRPFAVINTRVLPYGLGHEIGHVFGCGHHEYSGGTRTFPYGVAYLIPRTTKHTILGYVSKPKKQFFMCKKSV